MPSGPGFVRVASSSGSTSTRTSTGKNGHAHPPFPEPFTPVPAQRPEPFRSRPTLEALEDRVVPSFAIQSGSALLVGASPGAPGQVRTITLEADPTDPTKLDVFDTNTLLGQFSIASINSAAVSVQ